MVESRPFVQDSNWIRPSVSPHRVLVDSWVAVRGAELELLAHTKRAGWHAVQYTVLIATIRNTHSTDQLRAERCRPLPPSTTPRVCLCVKHVVP